VRITLEREDHLLGHRADRERELAHVHGHDRDLATLGRLEHAPDEADLRLGPAIVERDLLGDDAGERLPVHVAQPGGHAHPVAAARGEGAAEGDVARGLVVLDPRRPQQLDGGLHRDRPLRVRELDGVREGEREPAVGRAAPLRRVAIALGAQRPERPIGAVREPLLLAGRQRPFAAAEALGHGDLDLAVARQRRAGDELGEHLVLRVGAPHLERHLVFSIAHREGRAPRDLGGVDRLVEPQLEPRLRLEVVLARPGLDARDRGQLGSEGEGVRLGERAAVERAGARRDLDGELRAARQAAFGDEREAARADPAPASRRGRLQDRGRRGLAAREIERSHRPVEDEADLGGARGLPAGRAEDHRERPCRGLSARFERAGRERPSRRDVGGARALNARQAEGDDRENGGRRSEARSDGHGRDSAMGMPRAQEASPRRNPGG
jgi:hypothetical protein